jgi:hypothetical protein
MTKRRDFIRNPGTKGGQFSLCSLHPSISPAFIKRKVDFSFEINLEFGFPSALTIK